MVRRFRVKAWDVAQSLCICTTIGDEVRKAIDPIYEDIEEVKQLRLEITELKATVEQSVNDLRSMVKADNAKVIDPPNQRRAN